MDKGNYEPIFRLIRIIFSKTDPNCFPQIFLVFLVNQQQKCFSMQNLDCRDFGFISENSADASMTKSPIFEETPIQITCPLEP